MCALHYHDERSQNGGTSSEVPVDQSRIASTQIAFLLKSLRRQFRLVAAISLGGLLATFLLLQFISPRYQATASILFDTRQQRVINADTVLPGLSDDLYIVESQLEIIRSTRIANRVLAVLGREDPAKLGEGTLSTSELRPGTKAAESVQVAKLEGTGGAAKVLADLIPPTVELQYPPETIEKLLKNLMVERKGRSYIVEVKFSDLSGQRAARIANAFVDAYVADQLEAKFQATRAANLWLSETIREIGNELNVAEQDKQHFRAEHQLVQVGDLSLLQKELSDYSLQLVSARVKVAEWEARLNQVRSLSGDQQQLLSLEPSLESKVISDLRRQAGEAQRKLAEGMSRFGEQHPSVVASKAEIANLNGEIDREIQRIVENTELSLDAAKGKVKLLEQGLAGLKAKALQLGESQISLTKFERDIDASSALYSTLLRRYKETKAQEKLQAADARIVSYALPPSRPSFPKQGVAMLLASIAWLGMGAGFGLARERIRPVIRTAVDIEQGIGMRCIAALPVVDAIENLEDEDAPRNLLGPLHWRIDDELDDSYNQQIFKLRQWVTAGNHQMPHVVLVAGVHPADGCSTVAMQLARHAVGTGLKTALIDADLRSHDLTDVLNVAAEDTYAQAISTGADLKSTECHLIDKGVSFYAAPEGDCRPLDVLASRSMGKFLDILRDKFDLVILDSAPMATHSDADALLEHADVALLVVKAERTSQENVLWALRRLSDSDAQPAVGVVLNMVKPASH